MIFDGHFHIIDKRFPLVPNQGYLPEAFSCRDYMTRARTLGVVGGVVVSGSFQGYDQSYLQAALAELGPAFVGVTQLPAGVSNGELEGLDRIGVRAVRFNLKRGGSEKIRYLESFAKRLHERVGWHVELYLDASHLSALYPALLRLPAVSVDHLGLDAAGLPTLLKLVEAGVRMKATGFGRLDFDPVPALQRIAAVNPNALIFGTDLPSTRAKRPFQDADIDLIRGALGPELAGKVLYENAVSFYRPRRLME